MGILKQKVEVRVVGRTLNHYREKGYNCNTNDKICVDISDLPKTSGAIVKVECDYCGKIFEQRYYAATRSLNEVQKTACCDCAYKKTEEVLNYRYGVTNAIYLDFANEKKKNTCKEKYGNEYAIASDSVKKKSLKTNTERYGAPNIMMTEFGRQKLKEYNRKRLGVDYAFQNKEFLAYANEKAYEKYHTRLYVRDVSSQQRHIHQLIGGLLDKKIGNYYADILLPDINIVIEYDGGGHDLPVKLGKMSAEDFQKKDDTRDKVLYEMGYRTVRIKCPKDKLPPDNELKEMIYSAIDSFSEEEYLKIINI